MKGISRSVRYLVVTLGLLAWLGTAHAATIIVPDDMELQAALDAAIHHDTILIRAGTYVGPFSFGGKDLTIVGESGAASTILDGQNGVRVMDVGAGVTTDSQFSGLTFYRGFAARGSGIRVAAGSGLTLDGCEVRECKASGISTTGAITAEDGASLRVNDCTLRANRGWLGSGMTIWLGGSIEATDCRFVENESLHSEVSPGPGAYLYGAASATFDGCEFRDNHGGDGAISTDGGSSITVRNCLFRSNLASQLSALNVDGTAVATIESNTFIDEDVSSGDGTIMLQNCDGVFRKNTVAFCSSGDGGALNVWVVGHSFLIEQNIIANTTGYAMDLDPTGGTITVRCNDIWNSTLGIGFIDVIGQDGNFAADPQFCNPDARDLTLFDTSPCLAGQHPDASSCGLIGRYEEACDVVTVTPSTWSRIKRLGE